MTKIPQGEWSAIAARYAKGESVSGIARTYGCTPPAIHYILKRRKQCAAQNAERTVNGKPDLAMSLPDKVRKPATLASPGTLDPRDDCGTRRPALSGIKPVVSQQIGSQPVREPVAPSAGQGSQPVLTQRTAGRASAFTAGLDTELHGRAEAAIAAFRSSFEAALAEESPVVRQRLRNAASDLMRVVARTTIVLDRLNATAERDPTRGPHQMRWSEDR